MGVLKIKTVACLLIGVKWAFVKNKETYELLKTAVEDCNRAESLQEVKQVLENLLDEVSDNDAAYAEVSAIYSGLEV